MKFKEIIIVVLIMLICAIGMLIYIIINDTMEVNSLPLIGNLIENASHNNIESNGTKNIALSNQDETNREQTNIEENEINQQVNEKINIEQQEEPNYNFIAGNYIETNETVYATTNVNIRAYDNASCEKKGLLQSDEAITRTGIGDNGWSRVSVNGEDAYIASNYLTIEKPPEKIPVEIPIKNRNIDSSKPMVALTFDDGPNGTATPKF